MVNCSIYTRNLRNLVISFLALDPAMKALFKSLPIPISLLIAILCSYTNAANFEIRNNCPYTVWAASVPIGGGRQLNSGQIWNISVPAGTTQGRIWGRTNCTFDRAGRGRCETGDCNGTLECNSFGAPPNTMAEYALNQFGNQDFFDISLVNGFNVPMDFTPVDFNPISNECNLVEYSGNEYRGDNFYVSLGDGVNGQMEGSFASVSNTAYGQVQVNSTPNGCTRGIRCTADINGQCPNELRAPGGCNNPCIVFKTNQYCCNSGNCDPTNYSRFFKQRCPDVYSYPKDDKTSLFTCPGGTNYRVVFCP